MILRAEFSDKYERDIRPGEKTIKLEDGTTVLIFCCGPPVKRRAPQQNARQPTLVLEER